MSLNLLNLIVFYLGPASLAALLREIEKGCGLLERENEKRLSIIMTEKPFQEDTAPDADASGMKLRHPDPSVFSIVCDHTAKSPYITITGRSLRKDETPRIQKIMQLHESRRNKLLNMMNIAWVSLCMGSLLLSFPMLFILVAIFGTIVLKITAWLLVMSLIPCFYLMFQKHASVKTAQKLRGTVVGYSEYTDSESGRMYALIVEYYDKIGMKHKIISKMSSGGHAKEIGDQVVVLSYLDSSEPELWLFMELYTGYCIWLCAGIGASCFLFFPYVMEWLCL